MVSEEVLSDDVDSVASPSFLVTSPDSRKRVTSSHRVVNQYSNILTIDFDKN